MASNSCLPRNLLCDTLYKTKLFSSYVTINVYLAGVRLLHVENHFPDPTAEAHLLHYLCNGICGYTGDTKPSRLLITISLLWSIKFELSRDTSLHPRDKLMYWAALTLAFYGFLHASEYTSPTHHHYESRRHFLCEEVTLDHNLMKVWRKASKIDQYHQLAIILICRTGTPTLLKPCKTFWHIVEPIRTSLSSPSTMENSLLKEMGLLMTKSLLYLTVQSQSSLQSSCPLCYGNITKTLCCTPSQCGWSIDKFSSRLYTWLYLDNTLVHRSA